MAYPNNAPGTGIGGVPLGTRVEIMPSVPLPELNGLAGPAFAAQLKGDASSSFMGILCNAGLPPRIELLAAMRSINHQSLLHLADSGVVHWPPDDGRYYAFAFQRPVAPRMMQSLDEQHPVMTEDAINHYFVTPLVGALAELQRTGIVHNAIRPTNIFWRIGSTTMPQLGECLSTPPGLGQPALFETIERAMCTPIGRGTGAHTDDCYALGVTLAFLIFGQNPMHDMTEEAIIQAKIDRSSFGALVGTRRLMPSHIELLRGLLADDTKQRWTATDLEQWLSGRRLTPKNADSGKRASRAMSFGGKEYWQTRPLTAALAKNTAEAMAVIENGALDKWLRRALGDEERANDLSEAQATLKEGGKTANYEEQLIARTCIALDPPGPIRYRGLAVMPAGIANLLADTVATGKNVAAVSEIIASQLVTLWVDMQKDVKTEMVPLGQQFERMHSLIEKTSFGNGVERVLYELNPGLACLSPILRNQYVTNAKSLLPALERIAGAANRPHEPMDRHIAAFLIVRERRSENIFDAMTTSESGSRRGLALLTLYSEIQHRHGPDSVPALAQWLATFLEPAIQRYLGKAIKEKLHQEIRETASRGDLSALQRLVDDPKRIEHDQQDFMAARMLYLNILKEATGLEARLANRDQVIQSTGKPMAASMSSFLAIILVCAAIIRAVLQNILM